MNILQIGANSGNDYVAQFINSNVDDIGLAILVEPIPFVLKLLKSRYKHIQAVKIEPIAISTDEKETTLTLYYEDNSNYEVSSSSKKHLIDHGCSESKIKSIDVDALTVNKLMEKYNLTELDHLFIDAEGLDVHIIASLNFKKYKFKNITFEIAHTDGVRKQSDNYREIIDYLTKLGYLVEYPDGLNAIATLKETVL